MSIYLAALGFGLVSTAVIAIAAVGFTMQFGITNMINLAYGEIMISAALSIASKYVSSSAMACR